MALILILMRLVEWTVAMCVVLWRVTKWTAIAVYKFFLWAILISQPYLLALRRKVTGE